MSTSPVEGGGIDQDVFHRCLGPLGSARNIVTERVFLFFDRDEDGIINFAELVGGLSVLCKGTQEEKIICKSPCLFVYFFVCQCADIVIIQEQRASH